MVANRTSRSSMSFFIVQCTRVATHDNVASKDGKFDDKDYHETHIIFDLVCKIKLWNCYCHYTVGWEMGDWLAA
jgi:hypothetical protein